ncbi:MAG TPA: polysaccharide deacetylase family protein, partial [Candidatus Omnitrophota bacterium]|nr:polysaccharide deacetylase family protein [Candidatus Omnitrophota bacterium]
MFKKKKLIIWGGIGIGAAILVIFIRAQYVLPIAMYHSVKPVVPEGNRLIVSVDAFDRQMRFVKKNNYTVLPLHDAAALIKEGRELPRKALVLTFDDGYEDNYLYAYPILKKYGLPATIFLIVNDIGKP